MTSHEVKYCPECGADNLPVANHCYLCGRGIVDVKPQEVIQAELVPQRPPQIISEWIFGILTILLIGFLSLVFCSLAEDEAGAAVLFAIFVLPGIVIAGIGGLMRLQRGQQFGWARALIVVFMSTFVVVAVILMLFVAAIVVLIGLCLQALSSVGIQ